MAIDISDVRKELLEFFFDEFKNDPVGVKDWLAQGDYDADEFILEATRQLADLRIIYPHTRRKPQ